MKLFHHRPLGLGLSVRERLGFLCFKMTRSEIRLLISASLRIGVYMKNLVRSIAFASLITISSAGFASQGGGVPHPSSPAFSQGGGVPHPQSPSGK